MEPIRFTVLGKPQTAGSKKAFVVAGRARVTDDNPKSREWKNLVADKALEAMAGRPPLEGPLAVRFVFRLKRPKGHFGSGGRSHVVKDSAPQYPISKPDALKLARAVEDAMSTIVYTDDAQIVIEELHKVYDTPECVAIEVRQL